MNEIDLCLLLPLCVLYEIQNQIYQQVEIVRIPRKSILEIVEEKRDNAASHNHLYQASMMARHEGQVKERKFQVGELVWKTIPYV